MTQITIDRALVEQALEALKGFAYHGCAAGWPETITNLRAALAQQAEPVQEPVAWSGYDLDGMVEAFSRVIEAHHSSKHPFHDPINTDARMALRILRGFIPSMKAYAATPYERPGLSWDGFNISGDAQSVREVRRLVDFHAARRVAAP